MKKNIENLNKIRGTREVIVRNNKYIEKVL
jgi:hypothetical protein